MRLKCGATAWTARPRLLSTHSQVASRAVYSTRFAALAIRDPRILRPTRLVFSHTMGLMSHNLLLSGRVKNVYRHFLRFLTLMFSNKVKTDQYTFRLLFLRPFNTLRPSDTFVPIIYAILCIDMFVVRLAPCHYLNQYWHTLTWTNFSEVHIKILTSFFFQERCLKRSRAKRRPFCHSVSVLGYKNHICYVSVQF